LHNTGHLWLLDVDLLLELVSLFLSEFFLFRVAVALCGKETRLHESLGNPARASYYRDRIVVAKSTIGLCMN